MAAVTLENVYKSFPARPGDRAVVPITADLLAPVEAASAMETPSKSQVENARQLQAKHIDVLHSINLTIEDGEFMVLVGPSGCGKSTLLRSIAGLEELSAGNIWVGDRLVNQLPPKARDIAMVFQNYALYPHMSVYDNIAFGLRRTGRGTREQGSGRASNQLENLLVGMTSRLPKGLRYITARERAIDQRVRSVAALLQIESFLQRLPKQLSGGQKQRVALGRAIARNPQVFLMDEPLSNLDAKLRAETRAQIVKLQRQLGTTTIYVTHDQTEAMTMGDRIAVMHQGQIEQVARPLELYNHPATKFVAEFIGSPPMNFLSVQFHAPQAIVHPLFRLTLPKVWTSALHKYDGRDLILGIRPEHLNLSTAASHNLPVQVELVEALGNETYLFVTTMAAADATPTPLQVRIPPDQTVSIGEQLWLSLHPEKIHFFDPVTNLSVNREQGVGSSEARTGA